MISVKHIFVTHENHILYHNHARDVAGGCIALVKCYKQHKCRVGMLHVTNRIGYINYIPTESATEHILVGMALP